jgi:imidazolonepropionase-like amidohydrolase
MRKLVILAFVVSTVSICVLRAQDSGWILTNVQIVDLERGRVLDARTLHIRDDRIAAIVESPTAVQVAGLRTIDGQGSFVIPGLYDMHVHLVTNEAETAGRFLELDALPDRVLSSRIDQGVLGVRDMAFPINSIDVLARLGRGGNGDASAAPRIWYVGPALNAPSALSVPIHAPVADRSAVTAIVDRIAAAGGTAVKIHDRLSRETYAQIAEVARARGLPVVGHIPALVPIEDVIKERQRSVEHLGGLTHGILMACSHDSAARQRLAAALVPGDFARLVRVSMSAEHLTPLLDGFDAAQCTTVARRLREADVWQVPTLVLWKAWVSTGPGRASVAQLAAWQRLNRTMIDITRILHAERVPMMTGTDNIEFAIAGGSLHDELAALVDAGLTPLEALRAATVEPARFLNTAAVSGLVKPGFQADVVLLKGNPLVDIGNTRRVAGVVLRGKYHQVSTVVPAR